MSDMKTMLMHLRAYKNYSNKEWPTHCKCKCSEALRDMILQPLFTVSFFKITSLQFEAPY